MVKNMQRQQFAFAFFFFSFKMKAVSNGEEFHH
jgi:hypothetical protein